MEDFYRELFDGIRAASGSVVIQDGKATSYAEMVRDLLKLNGVLSDYRRERIALYTGKAPAGYSAIFSIFLSGNSWLPLNPDLPEKRTLAMLKVAQPSLILTDRELPQGLRRYAESEGIAIELLAEVLARPESAGKEFDFGAVAGPSFDRDDEAYVMFTSGSTGTPKGVPMTHGNFIPFVRNVLETLPLGRREVFADYHDFGFDLSIFILFACVLTKSTLAPAARESDRLLPLAHIRENGVTVLASVPSIVARIRALKRNEKVETPLRVLILCGEPFRLDLLEYCQDKLAVERIYNFYGLTETGVENFSYECQPGDARRYEETGFVPIGLPMKGNEIRVSDEGELWLAGPQITPGYLQGVGTDRFVTREAVRWFRTGDRIAYRDGLYFCQGRLDNQVKVGGYRIELMEIETHLRALASVDEAVCIVAEAGGRRFIAAGLLVEGKGWTRRELSDALRETLPEYMIPGSFFPLERIPLNKNGKVDRPAVVRIFEHAEVGLG